MNVNTTTLNAMYQWMVQGNPGMLPSMGQMEQMDLCDLPEQQGSRFEDMLKEKSQSAASQETQGSAPAKKPQKPETKPAHKKEETEEAVQKQGVPAALTALPGQTVPVAVHVNGEIQQAVEPAAEEVLAVPAEVLMTAEAGKPLAEMTEAAPVMTEQPADMPEIADTAEGAKAAADVAVEVPEAEEMQPQEQLNPEKDITVSKQKKETVSDDDLLIEQPGESVLFEQTTTVPVKVAAAQTVPEEEASADPTEQLQLPLQEALKDGTSHIVVSLTPANLGNVTIEITRAGDGSLHVFFATTTEKAADLLKHHSGNLQTMLAGESQAPVKIEIQHQDEYHSARQFLNPEDGGQRQQQQHRQQQENRQPEASQDFIQQLRLGLIQLNQTAL